MPKAIITGGTGYIGSHLARYLLEKGWDIAIISKPTSDHAYIKEIESQLDIFRYNGNIEELINFVKAQNADVIMHIAAAVITNYVPEQISTLVRSNIEFGTEILEAMRHSKTRLFIGTGSYWQNYKSSHYNPVDLYAATKEAFEKILQYYVDAFDFRAITLRLFDVYGEDDNRPKLWTILRDIAGTDKSIELSPGEQLLDLVHISDVVRAYESAYNLLHTNQNIRNEIYGISSEKKRSLKELVTLFEKTIKKPIKTIWGGKQYKQREVMNPCDNYQKLPNWIPLISVEKGFSKFNKS